MSSNTQLNWPPLRLPRERVVQLHADVTLADQNPLVVLSALAKLQANSGHLAHARKILRLLESEHAVADGELEVIRRMFPAAILAGAPDMAVAWLKTRYRVPYRLTLEPAADNVPVDVALMRVSGDALSFQLSPALFTFHAGDMILDRFVSMFQLWDVFMRSPDRIDGAVAINLLDNGCWPGLAFCDHRPDYFLVPDSDFMGRRQYRRVRHEFRDTPVAWRDREPLAFWRGTTSGIADPALGWRGLPRVRLCEIAAAHPGLIDAGITGISQIDDPAAPAELEQRGLTRPRVHPLTYRGYRYQIDIDGNSNAWEGFFLRLLTGSPVLKVASPLGFRQWYYDRLEPWVNFVPVAADMADLVEKVQWLRDNDDAARKIGAAGQALAESLDEREIARATPVIAAAMRADAGVPLTDMRFGLGAVGNAALGAGWRVPDANGVTPAATEAAIVMRTPGPGARVLLADISVAGDAAPVSIAGDAAPVSIAGDAASVSIAGDAAPVSIAANGVPLIQHQVTGRATILAAVPREVAGPSGLLNLSFGFPADPARVTLHRLAAMTPESADWAGLSGLDSLVASLNAANAPTGPHDLGSGPSAVTIPPATPRRMLMTVFDTIVYADRDTGRLRHAMPPNAPRNLVAVRQDNATLLLRVDDDGGEHLVRLRPEGPHAPKDDWILWQGGGFARAFAAVDNEASSAAFALRAADLYLCAEANGEITLSRQTPAEWERFHFASDG